MLPALLFFFTGFRATTSFFLFFRFNDDAGVLIDCWIIAGVVSQRPHPCEQSSCYPATGNLLIGREGRLSATSTCGLRKRVRKSRILSQIYTEFFRWIYHRFSTFCLTWFGRFFPRIVG